MCLLYSKEASDRFKENHKKIVFEGNMAKYSQNSDMMKALLKTLGTTLVEASPYDRVWASD